MSVLNKFWATRNLVAPMGRILLAVCIGVACTHAAAQSGMRDWWSTKIIKFIDPVTPKGPCPDGTGSCDNWIYRKSDFNIPIDSFPTAKDACNDRLAIARHDVAGYMPGACNTTWEKLWGTEGYTAPKQTIDPSDSGYEIKNCIVDAVYVSAVADAVAKTCTLSYKLPGNSFTLYVDEPLYVNQCPVAQSWNPFGGVCQCPWPQKFIASSQACISIYPAGQQYDDQAQACVDIPCPKGMSRSPIDPAQCVADDALPDPCTAKPGSCPKLVEVNKTNPVPQKAQTDIPECPPKNPPEGNPIYPLTGVKTERVSTGMWVGGLELALTYDTSSKAPGSVSSRSNQLTSFGAIWFSSLHRKLTVSAAKETALLAHGDGHITGFTGDGSGAFTTYDNLKDRLVSTPSGYRFQDTLNMAQEVYNSAGQLTSIVAATGKVTTFTYDSENNLIEAQDDTGRAIKFEYTAPNAFSPLKLVSRVIDSMGQTIVASYDTGGNLSMLTWQDGSSRKFRYQYPANPWALEAVTDENGFVYANFTYDADGRAISTEHEDGMETVDRFSATYTQPPSVSVVDTVVGGTQTIARTRTWLAPSGVVVTNPKGPSVQMNSELQSGMPTLTGMSQPAGSGCAASTVSMQYDSNGNRTTKDDFSGKRSCFAYDLNKNLANVLVEGLDSSVACSDVLASNAALPAGSRKRSLKFHPDWDLMVQSARPLSITTSVYNGQPDPFHADAIAHCAPHDAKTPDGKPIAVLCKQVVQATTDSNGALGLNASVDTSVTPQIARYTYDAKGRMLTATNSFHKTTSYTYYPAASPNGTGPVSTGGTVGDLQTITGPTGLVTSFDAYDALGRVLQKTEPTGVVTTITYTPRGWIKTVTSTPPGGAARTTEYDYDLVGQLVGVKYPDQTKVSFTYDGAHRLIGATDARGNSVAYVLDEAGNRVGEHLVDSSGVFLRMVGRAFDDLNRMQQMQTLDTTPFNPH